MSAVHACRFLSCVACLFGVTFVVADEREKPRLDPYGDPLPAEALLRLGPCRFRAVDDYTGLTVAPDGKTVGFVSKEGVRLVDVGSGKEVNRITADVVCRIAFLPPDGKKLLLDKEDALYLYDVKSGKEQFILTKALHDIQSISFSRDGKRAVFGTNGFGRKTEALVWDLDNLKKLYAIELPRFSTVSGVLSGDGKMLALWQSRPERDGPTLILWDVEGKKETKRLQMENKQIESVSFSLNGKEQATWSTGAVFSPDGRTLATPLHDGNKGDQGKVVLWEIATGAKRMQIDGLRSGVTQLAFSPNGRVLALSCLDTSILLWDLSGQSNTALQGTRKVMATEFDALWEGLDDADALKAYRLIQRLARCPAEATALVKSKLFPTKARTFDAAEVDKLIADLDHNDFNRREQASKMLTELGMKASDALIKALQQKPPIEKKRRIEECLERLKPQGPHPEMVRPTRALELLERIGTTEAKQVLADLAKGDPDAKLTQDAKATLQRLERRP